MNNSWYVYVIDLDKDVLKIKKFLNKNPNYKKGSPCVYVGQSVHEPKKRFQQHKEGYKSNRYAKKFGRWLKKKRIPDNNPHSSRKSAERREKELSDILRKRGWAVWSN